MSRTIFIGDVHACRDELSELLDRAAFTMGDRVVLVGDVVVRGPDPRGTLDLLRAVGARAVRGNHEDRLLRWRASPEENPLGDLGLATALLLRDEDWAFLEALPLWLDVPRDAHATTGEGANDVLARVVHAGLVPGVPIEQQDPRTLMYVRCLDELDRPVEKHGGVLWGERHHGPVHVVFGHNARPNPQVHPWATGLDTGCVYGWSLSALVLEEGQSPPPPAERGAALMSVRARRRYVTP